MIRYLLFTTLALSAVNSYGQYNSDKGWFTVNEIRGCAGLEVEIIGFNIVNGAPCTCFTDCSPSCDLDYDGDGTFDPEEQPNPLIKTYDESGTFELIVLFPGQLSDRVSIEILDKQAPEFDIFSCAGNRVQINISDNSYDNYVIDYGDGTRETIPVGAVNPEHIYPNSMSRMVTVRGLDNISAENCPVSTESLTPVVAVSTSTIMALTATAPDSIHLEYNLEPDVRQQLEISTNGTSNFRPVLDLENEDTDDTIPNQRAQIQINVDDNYYCFRIATFDPCSNNSIPLGYSNVICSIDFDVAYQDGVNRLTWTTEDPLVDFNIEKNQDVSQEMAQTRAIDDTDIICDLEYCYSIVADYGGPGITSRSLKKCGLAFSTQPPPEVQNVSLAVDGPAINLTWSEVLDIEQYTIRRDGVVATSVEEEMYMDNNLSTSETSYCYTISTQDQCGNVNNDAVIACSILLTGSIDRSNSITLSWNEYAGWNMGVNNYTIQKVYPGGTSSTFTSASNSFAEIDNNDNEQVISYTVTANAIETGVDPSVSNTITIVKPNNIYYPNAFTPDGNSINETFAVMGRYITKYELRMFNRWGEEIFITNDPDNGWNGTISGEPLPMGAYAFTCTIQDQAGREIITKGAVTLLRN